MIFKKLSEVKVEEPIIIPEVPEVKKLTLDEQLRLIRARRIPKEGDIIKTPEDFPWIRHMRNRIAKNKNMLAVITGETGSGKSWFALSVAEMFDKDFTVERCIFTPKGLMDLINSGTLKSGSVIIFDEVGVAMSNRNWQSDVNEMMVFLFETSRNLNLVLLLTLPYLNMLDAQIRRLLHAEWKMSAIDFTYKTSTARPKHYQYNGDMDKAYTPRLEYQGWRKKFYDDDKLYMDGLVKVNTWVVPMPSYPLVQAYEDKKRQYTVALNLKIGLKLAKIEAAENKKLGKEMEKSGQILQQGVELVDRKEAILNLIKDNPGLSNVKLAEMAGVSEITVRRAKRELNTASTPSTNVEMNVEPNVEAPNA